MNYLSSRQWHHSNCSAQFQNGATMIEVLISILVFSIGILGVAGTQTLGLTNTQSALNRSYAAQLSYDIIDIMRLNTASSKRGNATLDHGDGNIFDSFETTVGDAVNTYRIDPDCEDATASCSSVKMAEYALARWETTLENLLPDGHASIELLSTLTGIYELNLTWTDLKTEAERRQINADTTDGSFTYMMRFRP